MGKGQDRSVCENIWIVFSAMSIRFIGAGLLGRKD